MKISRERWLEPHHFLLGNEKKLMDVDKWMVAIYLIS
jgi:hypothetical protein